MLSSVKMPVGWSVSLLIGCLISASGCGPRTTPPGPGVVVFTLVNPRGNAAVTNLRWKEGLTVIICSDINCQYSGGGSTDNPVHTSRGTALATDGRHFDWNLQTTDGRTAKFSVDSIEYDLSKGALFFVTTKGGKTEVTQLSRDLSTVQPDAQSCHAFLANDPDVIELLGLHGAE